MGTAALRTGLAKGPLKLRPLVTTGDTQKFVGPCSSVDCNRSGRRDCVFWGRGAALAGTRAADASATVLFLRTTTGDGGLCSNFPLGAGCAPEPLAFTVDGVVAPAATAPPLVRESCFGFEVIVWPSGFVFGAPRFHKLGVLAPAEFTERGFCLGPFELTRRGLYVLDCTLTTRPTKRMRVHCPSKDMICICRLLQDIEHVASNTFKLHFVRV